MNDLCSACGKAPHFGSGCKVGPNTEKENDALKKYTAKVEPRCGICNSPDHETADCPKASRPRGVVFLDPPEQVECKAEPDYGEDKPPTIGEMKARTEAALKALGVKDKIKLDVSHLHPQMIDLLVECLEVQRVKGHDYTVGSKDRLANFRREAEKWGIPMEKAWGVYFDKHLCAIETYVVHGGQKESEPIRGRIVDAINYLLLFYLIVREKDPEAP